jgi:hypothetical protein
VDAPEGSVRPTQLPATVLPPPVWSTIAPEKRMSERARISLEPVVTFSPMFTLPAPSSDTSGLPEKPGAVRPSITRGSVITGSVLFSLIVPVTPNAIVSAPGLPFAEVIASRSEPAPASSVFVTRNVAARAPEAEPAAAPNDQITRTSRRSSRGPREPPGLVNRSSSLLACTAKLALSVGPV